MGRKLSTINEANDIGDSEIDGIWSVDEVGSDFASGVKLRDAEVDGSVLDFPEDWHGGRRGRWAEFLRIGFTQPNVK